MKHQWLSKTYIFTLFWLLIICFAVSNNITGQIPKLREHLAKQRETIEVASTVSNVINCSDGDIRLQVSITVKNSSDKPIVFCKECMTDMGIYVSNNTDLLYQDKLVYDLSSLGYGRPYKLLNPLPFEKPFVTVAQGSSFEFSVEPKLISADNKPVLKSGEYVFTQYIDTWSDSTDLDCELKSRWMKDGLDFWTDTIITEPAVLKLKKSKTQNCEE